MIEPYIRIGSKVKIKEEVGGSTEAEDGSRLCYSGKMGVVKHRRAYSDVDEYDVLVQGARNTLPFAGYEIELVKYPKAMIYKRKK